MCFRWFFTVSSLMLHCAAISLFERPCSTSSATQVFRGIAPQADLVNSKVLDAAGFGTPTSVIPGLEQAVRRNALVASVSLGWSEILMGWFCNNADCVLCQAADPNQVGYGLVNAYAAVMRAAMGAPRALAAGGGV
jgi:hypothetical protein